MTALLPFLVICALPTFFTAFFDKKFEETLHLTFLACMLVLYTVGLIFDLSVGFWVLTVLLVALYLLSLGKLLRGGRQAFSRFLSSFCTKGFLIFLILYGLCLYATFLMVPYLWDEFSHWADTVKVLYTFHDFGTNPEFYASYPHYPPGVSLLQYYILMLNGVYCDWILYFVKQLFALSLFFPFFAKVKNLFQLTFLSLAAFCLPLLFQGDFYNSVYIDTLLGLVFGFGIAYLFCFDVKKPIHLATICLTIFALCLIKEAGAVFAIGLVLIALCRLLRHSLKKSALVVISVAFPQLSWSWEMAQQGVTQASSREFSLQMLFTLGSNPDDAYRIETLNAFVDNFFADSFSFSHFVVSHALIFAGMLAVCMAILFFRRKLPNFKQECTCVATFYAIIFLYTVGMLISYMYFFSEYEAVRLASFDRYMLILYTAFGMFFFCFLVYISEHLGKTLFLIPLCILLIPQDNITALLHRETIALANFNQSAYLEIIANYGAVENPKDTEHIMVIAQNSTGLAYRKLKYYLRPDLVTKPIFSFGALYYQDDYWTLDYTLEEWQAALFDLFDYDIIIMYDVDDQFIDTYGDAFLEPDTIKNQSIFHVNHENRTIETIFSN